MATAVIRRYVALGDSLTEGIGDDRFEQDRIFAGWADRFAVLLNQDAIAAGEDFLYANLAVRSRNSSEILSHQVDEALLLEPDLVTIMAGANDLWRPRKSWELVRAQFTVAVEQLKAAGVTVVLTNCINPVHHWSFRGGALRAKELTKLIEEVAREQNVLVLDVYRSPTLRRLRVWSDDCVHFGPRGHAHVANKAAKLLGLPYRIETPVLEPRLKDGMTLLEHAKWIVTHVTPFVGRRLRGIAAGDGIKPKRPVLSRIHDHPWTIRRSKSSPLVHSPFPTATVLAE
ncbi:SGNH/GDSL hydrolase family protein [Aurantimicrobium minutum]|uniref:SGNH/GDSL hydrolase family protein n=1 Tax=Aurantimicrobium minutum TaxID=708131 RepID=UPI00247330C6|nr:SGNH/GDSL hydrolase family protein [Aurantimicrobium minutum]MDH6423294.1 lysophospholipase L1-like esterase [Aurantimicrobium minutum]